MKQVIQFGFGLAITALFVVLIARNVNGAELLAVLRQARAEWVALAIVLFLLGYACRISRWQLMLRHDNNRLRWADCALPLLASVAANNVLPFRIGDVLRVFGFSRQLDVPITTMLASLIVERLLDLMCLLIALACCFLFIDFDFRFAERLTGLGGLGVLVMVIMVAGLLLFPHSFERPVRMGLRVLSKISPPLADKISSFSDRVFEALRRLSHGPQILKLFGWSALAWIFEGLVFWATACAIPSFRVLAALLAFPVSTLATLLPSSPGYVGTFDYFAIASAEALGTDPAAATAFALLVHLVIWLPTTVIGGIGLAYLSLNRHSKVSLFKVSNQTSDR